MIVPRRCCLFCCCAASGAGAGGVSLTLLPPASLPAVERLEVEAGGIPEPDMRGAGPEFETVEFPVSFCNEPYPFLAAACPAAAVPAAAPTAAPMKGITTPDAADAFVTNALAIKGAATMTAPSKRCITANSIIMFAERNMGSASGRVIKVSDEPANNMENIAIISPCTIGHTSANPKR